MATNRKKPRACCVFSNCNCNDLALIFQLFSRYCDWSTFIGESLLSNWWLFAIELTELSLNKLKRLRPLDVSADTYTRYMYYNCLGLLKLDINAKCQTVIGSKWRTSLSSMSSNVERFASLALFVVRAPTGNLISGKRLMLTLYSLSLKRLLPSL